MGASSSSGRNAGEQMQLSNTSTKDYAALQEGSWDSEELDTIKKFIRDHSKTVDGAIARFLLKFLSFQKEHFKNSAIYRPVVLEIVEHLLTFFDNPIKDQGAWNGIENQVSVSNFAQLVSLRKRRERGNGPFIVELTGLRKNLMHIRSLVVKEASQEAQGSEGKAGLQSNEKNTVRDYFIRNFSAPVPVDNQCTRYVKLDRLLLLSFVVQLGVFLFSLMEGCFWEQLPCPIDDKQCMSSDFSKNEFFRHPVLYTIFSVEMAYVAAQLLSGCHVEYRRRREKKETIKEHRKTYGLVDRKDYPNIIREIQNIAFSNTGGPLIGHGQGHEGKAEAHNKNSQKMLAVFLFNLREFFIKELKSSPKYVSAMDKVLDAITRKELSEEACQKASSALKQLLYRKDTVSPEYFSKFQEFFRAQGDKVHTSHDQRRRSTQLNNSESGGSKNDKAVEASIQKFAYIILSERDRRWCWQRVFKLPKDRWALMPFGGMLIPVMYTLLDDCFNPTSRCPSWDVTCTDNAAEWIYEKMNYHMVLTATTGLSSLTVIGVFIYGCVRQCRTENKAAEFAKQFRLLFETSDNPEGSCTVNMQKSDGPEQKTP